MTTTHPPIEARSDPRLGHDHVAAEHPALADVLQDIVPVIGVVAVAGPPVVLLAGPLVLLALALVGAFAVLLTLGALLVAAWFLIGLIGAALTGTYVLLRSVHVVHSPRVRA